MEHEIEATGPGGVRDAIAALGRTEDLRFSPDGRRMAITCFNDRSVAIIDVEVVGGEASVQVALIAFTALVAPQLERPHGVDWLDDRTLIVADRAGQVALVEVPDPSVGRAVQHSVDLLPLDGAFADLYGPGSVTVTRRGEGEAEVLVCNNWGNRLTRHRLRRGRHWAVAESEVCLQRFLDLPDGVATTPDGSCIAVSNHNLQVVVVYESDLAQTDIDRAPIGVLRGTSYPHGIRFSPDGEQLLVADAGSPFVHGYQRVDDSWSVAGYPSAALQVMEWDEFDAGNDGPGEGGPKGIDLDPTARVLAVTCGEAPLRWFDLRAAGQAAAPSPAGLVPLEIAALERETALKAQVARAELRIMETETREFEAQALASRTADQMAATEQRAAQMVAAADQQTAETHAWAVREIETANRRAEDAEEARTAIEDTLVWRAVAPLRRLYARVRNRGAKPRA